jgi:hypothetical protein
VILGVTRAAADQGVEDDVTVVHLQKLIGKTEICRICGISLDTLNRMLARHPEQFRTRGKLYLTAEDWTKLYEAEKQWTSNTAHRGSVKGIVSGSSVDAITSKATNENSPSRCLPGNSLRKKLNALRRAS